MTKENEKVYLGKTLRLIIQQTISLGQLWNKLREKYNIKVLSNSQESIILVEEKEKD